MSRHHPLPRLSDFYKLFEAIFISPKLPRHSRMLWGFTRKTAFTVFLFIKSDIKTIMLPISTFGIVAARESASMSSIWESIIWVFVFLLQFCISNQSLSPEEDQANKPWRPIPAKRISVNQAKVFRWILLPVCLGISLMYGVTWPGLALSIGILAHNEMKFDSHWFSRSICNALGYASFNAGATSVACGNYRCITSPVTQLSHLHSAFIVLFTIHAQDFEDIEGDKRCGRKTLPIVIPFGSRIVLLTGTTLFSIFLVFQWQFRWEQACVLVALGIYVGLRFLWFRDKSSDKRSYIIYNLWLSVAQILPLIQARKGH